MKILNLGLFLLFFMTLIANDINEINKNIKKGQEKQQNINKQREMLNTKLSTLGNNINNNIVKIKKLDSKIQELSKNIESNKNQNKTQGARLKNLESELLSLNERLESNQHNLSTLILRYMTYSQVLDDEEVLTLEDIITRGAFNILKKQTMQNIADIQKEQESIAKQIDNVNKNITQVTQIITSQETRQQELQSTIQNQQALVENMRVQMKAYNDKLKEINTQKRELDSLLSKLNILKKNTEEINKRKEQERLAKLERERVEKLEKERQRKIEQAQKKAQKEREEAQKKAKLEAQKIAKLDSKKAQEFLGEKNKAIDQEYETKIQTQSAKSMVDSFDELKRIDSVYKKPNTTKYTGKKTPSPLDSYSVEQNFGDYIDPVYKIKIFNNGVVLKPKSADAQVYNIMDGKVIYAQEMAGLKKVVVIEHANKINTIYSMLDKIPPTLKQGFVLTKGYVIGRVSDRLNLEIIQDGKHINPMEVIARR